MPCKRERHEANRLGGCGMIRDFRRIVLLALALLCFQVACIGNLWAAEMKNAGRASDLSNIGFMKNPPKVLTERFPMCDAFLNVKWIDKKKRVGYAHYDAYVYNVHGKLSDKKKKVWALVKLADDWTSYSLDAYPFMHQGKTKKLFDLVKKGNELKNTGSYQIKYQGKISVFYELNTVLKGYQQTVCLLYPNEQRALIIESKDVKHAYGKAQQKALLKRIRRTWPTFRQKLLNKLWLLDINFDGKEDYFFGPTKTFAYSWGNKIYFADFSVSYPDFILTFPPKSRTCHLKIGRAFPLTTDGKNYYIRDCNLTKPTSQF